MLSESNPFVTCVETRSLVRVVHSWCLGHVKKKSLIWGIPENRICISTEVEETPKEHHKEIRMVEVGKDWHGLPTMNLKNLGWIFQQMQAVTWLPKVLVLVVILKYGNKYYLRYP